MTHLHGGFVAGRQRRQPGGDAERVRPRRDADRPLHQPAAADAGLAAVVPRPRPRRDAAERVRRARRRLHPPRRVRHRRRAEPDRDPRRRLRDPARRSRTASSTRTGRSSTRPATSRARPGSASTSATSMLVNGKVWPFLDVEPRMYRFRILNGCNARILNLDIGGPSIWQIGAEGGMWDQPVPVKQLVLAPAERADVLVDFSKFAGADAGDEEPQAAEAGRRPRRRRCEQVMQIRVGTTVSQPGPTTIPTSLPGRARPTCASPVTHALHHAQRDRRRRADLVPEPERRALRRRPGDGDARRSGRSRTGSTST